MDSIRIKGGQTLKGRIHISGAKNAALPLLAACLLTEEELTLGNVPHLADIVTMSNLLGQLGVDIGLNGHAPDQVRYVCTIATSSSAARRRGSCGSAAGSISVS